LLAIKSDVTKIFLVKTLHTISPDLQHTHSSNENFHWSDARNQSFQSKQPLLGTLYAEHHTNRFHEKLEWQAAFGGVKGLNQSCIKK
jgi:hypothetical protein